MKDKYEIFISSTHDDLIEERKKITEVLLAMECIPCYMESFYASDISTWDFIKDILSRCDYYIIILAGRYGSICEETGKSFTQMEYEYAKKLNIPICRFLYKDPEFLPFNKHDKDIVCQKNFLQFRELLQEGKIVKYWSNPDELACSVAISLHHYIKTDIKSRYVNRESNDRVENDIYSNLKKIESVIKEISNYNPPLVNKNPSEEKRTNSSGGDISHHNKMLDVGLENDPIFMDTLKEFANIILSTGFNSLSYFFDVRMNMSFVKAHFFKNNEKLQKFIDNTDQIITGLTFHGYISGSIIIKCNKYYKARIFNIVKRIYSLDLNEYDKTICDTFFQELTSIFVGSAMTSVVLFLNNIKVPVMEMGTTFNYLPENDNTYAFALSSDKHNFLEFESLLLLTKENIWKLWEVIENSYF